MGLPDRSFRTANRLMKKPIIRSVSGVVRLARSVPTTICSWPEYRDSKAWKPAINVMKRVAPSWRRKFLQPAQGLQRNVQHFAGTPERPGLRAGTVKRQDPAPAEDPELLAPEGKLLLQHFALEPLPLLRRVIGVLQRQLRKRRRIAGGKRFVQRAKFLQKDSRRPGVADDVMHGQQQDVVVICQRNKMSPHQRTSESGRKVAVASSTAILARLVLARRSGSPVQVLNVQAESVRDGAITCTGCPSFTANVVRCDSCRRTISFNACSNARACQCSLQSQRPRNVVERIVRLHLVEHPETFLGKRERQRSIARYRRDRRRNESLLFAPRAVQMPRQFGDGGSLEYRSHRHRDAKVFAQPGGDLRRQQRVSANLKEVVLDTDSVTPQYLFPDGSNHFLARSARRNGFLLRPCTSSGLGNAWRSIFPLALSGNFGNSTIAAGTM